MIRASCAAASMPCAGTAPRAGPGGAREVESTRQVGFGLDIDQYILGVTVVSAPVMKGGEVTHALVVVGLSERLRERTDEIGAELARLAAEVSRRLEA